MTNKTQQFWDKQARKYDSAEMQFDHVYKNVIAKTRRYLHVEDHVLDFGCATGTKTIQLAEGIKHIHGLDISPEMINEAMKKKDKASIQNISFSQGTIWHGDLKTASFDAVIAFGIIHLLEDPGNVIRRIRDLLKPQGLFISTIPCFKDNMAFKTRLELLACLLGKLLGTIPIHLNRFTVAEAKSLITDQHFQLIDSEDIYSGISSIFIVARKY